MTSCMPQLPDANGQTRIFTILGDYLSCTIHSLNKGNQGEWFPVEPN